MGAVLETPPSVLDNSSLATDLPPLFATGPRSDVRDGPAWAVGVLPSERNGCEHCGQAKGKAEAAKGKVKKGTGKAIGNPGMEAKGKAKQVKGDLKQAKEKVKDAGKK